MKDQKFSNKVSMLNFISNLGAFFVTYAISFFLSPYIVKVLGEEAYGFVSLATNFTNYISLATVALNSLAGRFISVAIFENKMDKAKGYYTSVVISNLVLTTILSIPSLLFIWKLEMFIEIQAALVFDVKVLFFLVFSSFFVSLLGSLFSIATFVENRLYLNAIHNAEGAIIRLALTILLFVLFPAKILYIGITTLIVNVYIISWQKYYMSKYLPQMKVETAAFDIKKVFELLKAGVWGLVSQLSGILNNGLDLLLANKFISASSMGILAIASTLPTIIQSILSSVSSVFTPGLTKYYAQNKYDELTSELKKSMRMMSVVLIVPMAGLTVFGGDFYALWQPTQPAMQLQILSVLKILCLTFTGSMAVIHEVFIVANKLKAQAIATLISGIANFVIVLVLLGNPKTDIYVIAGVSSVIAIVRNFVFTFPYAAKCIKQKWYVFYTCSLQCFGVYFLICVVYLLIRNYIMTPRTWIQLLIIGFVCGIIGIIINLYLMLGKEERTVFIKKVLCKFQKR